VKAAGLLIYKTHVTSTGYTQVLIATAAAAATTATIRELNVLTCKGLIQRRLPHFYHILYQAYTIY